MYVHMPVYYEVVVNRYFVLKKVDLLNHMSTEIWWVILFFKIN